MSNNKNENYNGNFYLLLYFYTSLKNLVTYIFYDYVKYFSKYLFTKRQNSKFGFFLIEVLLNDQINMFSSL